MQTPNKAVFLDRDGTLIGGYSGRTANLASEIRLLPGVTNCLRALQLAGFLLVIVTNQGGIERGFVTLKEFLGAMQELRDQLKAAGVTHILFKFCPHYDTPCTCRKPKPGMITEAAQEFNIDLLQSYMVGDLQTDIDAALAANIPSSHCYIMDANDSSEYREGVAARIIDTDLKERQLCLFTKEISHFEV